LIVWAFFVLGSSKERIFLVNDLLTVAEVAEILHVDETTVRRWVKQGVLEAVALPHAKKRVAYRVKRETVEKLLSGSLS
jgi:excisionase family DNA binding protein